MKITVRRWGNSLAVRIPKLFALKLGIDSGSDVDISVTKEAIVLAKSKNTLEDLLEKVTSDNVHGETGTGMTLGSEIW